MRIFSAVALLASLSPVAVAQRVTAAPRIVISPSGALGGKFASGGISRPLGGIAPSASTTKRRTTQSNSGGRYAGSGYVGPVFYVPNAYGVGYDSYAQDPGPLEADASQPAPANGPRFISRQVAPPAPIAAPAPDPVTPGDPLVAPQNYYLIAYKDHSVYPALAYWVEADTIHYVTTQNTHNQASLALIDLDQTTKLNADNNVPFSLTGK